MEGQQTHARRAARPSTLPICGVGGALLTCKMSRQIEPFAYTFGWNIVETNLTTVIAEEHPVRDCKGPLRSAASLHGKGRRALQIICATASEQATTLTAGTTTAVVPVVRALGASVYQMPWWRQWGPGNWGCTRTWGFVWVVFSELQAQLEGPPCDTPHTIRSAQLQSRRTVRGAGGANPAPARTRGRVLHGVSWVVTHRPTGCRQGRRSHHSMP